MDFLWIPHVYGLIFHLSSMSDLFRLCPLLLKLFHDGKRRSLVEDLGEMARRATPPNTSNVLAIQQHPAMIGMRIFQKVF